MSDDHTRNLVHTDAPDSLLPRCPHNKMAPCLTETCAAWRFTATERVYSLNKEPPGAGWLRDGEDHWIRPDPSLGYCGLAGRP